MIETGRIGHTAQNIFYKNIDEILFRRNFNKTTDAGPDTNYIKLLEIIYK